MGGRSEADLKIGGAKAGRAEAGAAAGGDVSDAALPVGPFFLIVALIIAIGAFVLLRTQPIAALGVIAFTLIGAGLAGTAVYRMIAPLTGDMPMTLPLVGGRTRAALERDKALTLRSLKELEFDRAMGKLSEADFVEMRDRLRARAVRLMRQLDDTSTFRDQIERDVQGMTTTGPRATHTCASCGTAADADARFCKMCGTPIPPPPA